VSGSDPVLPRIPGNEPPAAREAANRAVISNLAAKASIAQSTISIATTILSTATAALRADYDYQRAEERFRQNMINVWESGGNRTADAFARATLRDAQQTLTNARTAEDLATAVMMVSRLSRELEARGLATPPRIGPSANTIAAVGVVTLALGVGLYVYLRERKPRPNPSTRSRRAR
jgi:hypothetical protein